MASVRASATAALAAAAIAGSVVIPSATAGPTKDYEINGTYLATSIGEWAKTNYSYHNEATVRSTWKIKSSCTDPYECSGEVSSDQGWTASIRKTSVSWILDREVADWERCDDGTAFPGKQKFRFYPVDGDGQVKTGSPVLAGEDKTIGPSGACGKSQRLIIVMPFKLVKTD
jgi:hypothetical protein